MLAWLLELTELEFGPSPFSLIASAAGDATNRAINSATVILFSFMIFLLLLVEAKVYDRER
nr:MAG TPA: hypothetical protein [Caudoviricetes sp.]